MRKYLYFSTVVAGIMMAAGGAMAQSNCTTQDCAALGYTDSACPGNGLKCPFGDSWYCDSGGAAEDCIKLGYDKTCTGAGESGTGQTCNGKYQSCNCDSAYKYTCSGTGYAGGSGTACGGKYQSCTCSSPYTWSGSACTCPSTYAYTCSGTGYAGGSGTACGGKYTACTCASGYEWKNGSCQEQILNGADGDVYKCKGKVVGVKAGNMDFYVAMKDLGSMTWSSANSSCQSYVFCGKLKGTLPTTDQLRSIYNNKSQVNTLLSANGGTKMTEDWYWSSTHHYNNYSNVYLISMSSGSSTMGNSNDGYGNYVRPVLTSW